MMKTATHTLGNSTSEEADELFWSGWRRAMGIGLLLASMGTLAYVMTRLLTGTL